MARTGGAETKQRIELAARGIAEHKGFTEASQREIAEAAGVSKPLVQYHFPEKQAFVSSFIEDMLDLTDHFLQETGLRTDDYFGNLLLVGGGHFAYLLQSKKMRKITLDLTAQRINTDTLVTLEIEWATRYMGPLTEKENARWPDLITMIMGGAYELIYRKMRRCEELSPRTLIERCVETLATGSGMASAQVENTLAAYEAADIDYSELIEYLDGHLF